MRYMIIVKSTPASEAGVLPSEKLLADMGRYNEELAIAGVMLAGEGLPAEFKGRAGSVLWRKAIRVRFSPGAQVWQRLRRAISPRHFFSRRS